MSAAHHLRERAAGAARRTPVAIVGGFLGAGKTTLLARALADPCMANTAVIVNEFGEIGIDHLLVRAVSERVIELRNGCICCTLRGDLALSLRELQQQRLLGEVRPFDRVVVETTGLADPVPLLNTLRESPAVRAAYDVDAVIVCVDALEFAATVAGHACARAQVAIADVLLLTKTDLVEPAHCAELLRRLRALNPQAAIVPVAHGDIEAARLFGCRLFEPAVADARLAQWLATETTSHAGHAACADHGTDYTQHAVLAEQPLSLAGTAVFLNRVANTQRAGLLRIKGLAAFAGREPRVGLIHAVRDRFAPIRWLDGWPGEDRRSRIMFIGQSLDREWIDDEFRRLC